MKDLIINFNEEVPFNFGDEFYAVVSTQLTVFTKRSI